MKVLRLVMTSFGQQRNKIIDFSEDTNLIMGADADTLQTVRVFLDGMLFGLSKEDKRRYRPEKGTTYSGVMYVKNDDGVQLKVERNFLNDRFKVTDSDGNNVTENYLNEYGDLALLPLSDTIFAREGIKVPEASQRDRKKLLELENRRRNLVARNDYEGMLKKREEYLKRLEQQRQLESEMEHNNTVISENEERVRRINEERDTQTARIEKDIAVLKAENEEMDREIEGLRSQASAAGNGKTQILKRNIQGTEDQLHVVEQRLEGLKAEEKTYNEKLEDLENSFEIDRDELRTDYEAYQRESQRTEDTVREPLMDRLASWPVWIYTALILIGVAGVSVALLNPTENLERVAIFLICFFSVFLILISSFTLYIRVGKRQPVAAAAHPSEGTGEAQAIIEKYNQKSGEDFNAFYNDAKKVFVRIDNVKSDLEDIQKEIRVSEREKRKLLEERDSIKADLAENEAENAGNDAEERILELTKAKNKNSEKIEALDRERKDLDEDSVWKLREEAVKLKEANEKIKSLAAEGEETLTQFNKLQRRIDRYESKLHNIEKQINRINDNIEKKRYNYIMNYVDEGSADYNKCAAKQFAFGLQRNLGEGYDVPYITFNPFDNTLENVDVLAEKLRNYIIGKQVLIFTTRLETQDLLKKYRMSHNGIYIANTQKS